MKRHLKGLGVILVAASTLLAGACSSGGHKKGGATGGTLTISNASGGLWTCGFNPFNSSVNYLVTGNVYEPLVFVNALQDQKVTPWLATAWQWSNNNTTVTFTIRDGVKWSDGQPMTAADVLFTFNLLKKYPAIDINSIWQVIKDVGQQGNKIVVDFKTPAVPYLFYVADQLPILPQHVWASVGDPAHFNNNHPVGTGAYVVSQCTPQNVTYTANKGYWQPGLPKISKVLYPAFTDNGPANTYLATGQAQWGSQFIPNINSFYVKRSATHHYWNPPIAQVSLFPNLKVAPLNDVAVRKAMAYAVDRAKAAQIAEDGQVPAGNQVGVVTPTYQSWVDPAAKALDDYTFNVAKADQTLESAGYKKGSDGIYVSPKGKRLSFTVINQAGYSDWVAATQTIKQSFKQAGIDLTISNLSSDAYFQKLYNGQFDLAYYAEQNVGPSPYYELRDWLYSTNTAPIGQAATTNMERYSDPATDKLFDDYAATADPARQKQIIGQIEQVVVTQIPVIPVTQQPDWFQYDTGSFTGWPSQSNPYALPAAFQYPDMGQVLLHLQPK